jgi:predicted RND superfamily exporter protein
LDAQWAAGATGIDAVGAKPACKTGLNNCLNNREAKQGVIMIVLGIILIIIGAVVPNLSVLYTIGAILVLIGVVLWILGAVGRPVGGRKVWY